MRHAPTQVPEEKVSELREWFRNYKTAEGKGKNKFGLDEKAMPRKYAEAVVEETHEVWLVLQASARYGPTRPSSP